MSTGTLTRPMTTEEFDALPDDDGVERELIRGELREFPMTKRNRHHSRSMMEIGRVLLNWAKSLPRPWGEVVGGEAGFRLRRDPDTTVGIDVAYVSAERLIETSPDSTYYQSPPNVAVEVLAPWDTQLAVNEKIKEYLACGVELVLILEPDFRTVTAYRPGQPPQFFTADQDLTAEDVLPGFRVRVGDLFA